MTKAEISRIENELLFSVQGVGSVKTLNGFKVYVKGKYAQESIRELIKHLKNDTPSNPIVRLTLGRWKFLEETLIQLLILHKADKKLSFLTLMLAV
jgi:hypothetical protein